MLQTTAVAAKDQREVQRQFERRNSEVDASIANLDKSRSNAYTEQGRLIACIEELDVRAVAYHILFLHLLMGFVQHTIFRMSCD